MITPIPAGAILRQRYVIQRVLGQGGFGRTYLALDQERFNELCALKEFTVPYQDETQLDKSRMLFQREANVLHQIQHPQIPRFWAAFEDHKRLFLVQDYIQGQTYRQILSDRKPQGRAFSEPEVLYFLSCLLPVLSYIHDREIIHRDITPENVILHRESTPPALSNQSDAEMGLPVLIDFGAVKEVANYGLLNGSVTRVGKIGYAPPEQLQTGKVYPNSDLYALAASSLVLLTGREPQTLLDSRALVWNWEPYACISDALSLILNKMLAFYPEDRYPTAQDVLLDLQPLLSITETKEDDQQLLSRSGRQPVRLPVLNRQRETVAISAGSPFVSTLEDDPAQQQTRIPSTLLKQTQLKQRQRFAAIAVGLIALGVATPILWRLLLKPPDQTGEVWISGAKLSQAEASRIMGTGTNNLLKAPSDPDQTDPNQELLTPAPGIQPIQFPAGQISTMLQGNLAPNGNQTYLLKANQGQIMTATLEGGSVTMNLLRSNQEAIDAAAYQTRSWTGQLPVQDNYLIQVMGTGLYRLEVAVTPTSRPSREQTQRVSFARGRNGTTVTGKVNPTEIRRYLMEGKKGQILMVKVLQGKVDWSAIAPNGQRIGGSATDTKDWKGPMPSDGDYVIEVTADHPSQYALAFEMF